MKEKEFTPRQNDINKKIEKKDLTTKQKKVILEL